MSSTRNSDVFSSKFHQKSYKSKSGRGGGAKSPPPSFGDVSVFDISCCLCIFSGDSYGRKDGMVFTYVILILFAFIEGFSLNYYVVVLCRIMIGFSASGKLLRKFT